MSEINQFQGGNNNMWYIWLIVAGFFFIIEMATVGFLVFWLAIAALVTAVVSLITDSFAIQITVFAILSCTLIPLTKPLVDKYITKGKTFPTNIDSLIGKHGVVTKAIKSAYGVGQVKVNGEIWSAKCEKNIEIAEGTEVEVLNIDGVKLIITPLS